MERPIDSRREGALTNTISNIEVKTCEVIIPPSNLECPKCIPNPAASIPDWTTLDQTEPFLNERTCEYSITVETEYKTIENDEQIANMLSSALLEGVTDLISFYDKDPLYEIESGVNSHQFLLESATPSNITNIEYYVNTKNLPIKVLITISADVFDSVPSISELPENERPPENNVDTKELLKIYYNPKTFKSDIRTLLNGLLYLSFLFEKDRISGNAQLRVFSLVETFYHMKKYTNKIKNFMRDNNIRNLSKVDGINIYYKEDFSRIEKIEIKKLAGKYKEIKKKKIIYLSSSPLTNSMNNILFSQLKQIVTYFETNSKSSTWEKFVKKFLPPDISENLIKESPSGDKSYDFENILNLEASINCKNLENVKKKSKKAFKKVGRNVKNEVISYPDATLNDYTSKLSVFLKQKQKITPLVYSKKIKELNKTIENNQTRLERIKDAKLREFNSDDSLFNDLIYNLLGKSPELSGSIENAKAALQDKVSDPTSVSNFSDLYNNLLSKVPKHAILGMVSESFNYVSQEFNEKELYSLALKTIIKSINEEGKVKEIVGLLPDNIEAGFRAFLKEAQGSDVYPWESAYKDGQYDPSKPWALLKSVATPQTGSSDD